MKAAIYEGPGQIRVGEWPTPSCPADGLIVRPASCTICGTDLRIIQHGQADVRPPMILGHEIVGTVVEVGSAQPGFRPGDAVAIRPSVVCGVCPDCQRGAQNFCAFRTHRFGYTIPGGFAELIAVPGLAVDKGSIIPLEPRDDLTELSVFEPLACVLNGQETAGVGLGDRVAIIGAGPVGCMQIVLARRRGARQIVVADLLASRIELAGRFEPDAVVDSSREDPVERVVALTAGGADVVIVACSARSAQEQALRMAARGGRIVFFAGLPPEASLISFDSNLVHYRQLSVFGLTGSNFRQQNLALRLLLDRTVDGRRLITRRLKLADFLDGLAGARAGGELKVALQP